MTLSPLMLSCVSLINQINGPSILYSKKSNPLTKESILSNYIYYNSSSIKLAPSILNENYFNNMDKIGKYYITLVVIDNIRKIEKTIDIIVYDDLISLPYIQPINISVVNSQYLDAYSCYKYLLENNFITYNKIINCYYDNNEYQNYFNIVGSYNTNLIIEYSNSLLKTQVIPITINVSLPSLKEEFFYEKILNIIYYLFEKLLNF